LQLRGWLEATPTDKVDTLTKSSYEVRFSPDGSGILLRWAGCGHLTEGSLAEQECHQTIVPAPPSGGDTRKSRISSKIPSI